MVQFLAMIFIKKVGFKTSNAVTIAISKENSSNIHHMKNSFLVSTGEKLSFWLFLTIFQAC